MKRLLTCVAALLVLHACNFKGGGTWSDSAGNSGEFKSKLTLKLESKVIVYKIKLPDGTKETFKFTQHKAEEESEPDADAKSFLIANTKGEVIGEGRELEEETVFSFAIDDERIELRLSKGEDMHELMNDLVVTGTKTFRDGRVLTWSDSLTLDM